MQGIIEAEFQLWSTIIDLDDDNETEDISETLSGSMTKRLRKVYRHTIEG